MKSLGKCLFAAAALAMIVGCASTAFANRADDERDNADDAYNFAYTPAKNAAEADRTGAYTAKNGNDGTSLSIAAVRTNFINALNSSNCTPTEKSDLLDQFDDWVGAGDLYLGQGEAHVVDAEADYALGYDNYGEGDLWYYISVTISAENYNDAAQNYLDASDDYDLAELKFTAAKYHYDLARDLATNFSGC